jgi:FKBP12-rapamycin complex-associated protein
LQKVLWLKSPNSETWLDRRTEYTRSLATMSIVGKTFLVLSLFYFLNYKGYMLGLGDRHPSNIML